MCKPNKYFPPQIGFGQCFSTATEAKLGQIGTTERDITEIGLIKDFQRWIIEGFWSFQLERPLSAQSLINCCRNLEDNADRDPDDEGLAYEFPEGSKDYQGCSCDILELTACGFWSVGAEESATIKRQEPLKWNLDLLGQLMLVR